MLLMRRREEAEGERSTLEDVCGERSVRLEDLSRHRASHSMILLRDVSQSLSTAIHNDVLVRLLESDDDVHHLYLSLNDQTAVPKNRKRRVIRRQDAIWVCWYVDFRDEI